MLRRLAELKQSGLDFSEIEIDCHKEILGGGPARKL
jgi:hypothetical protein